MSAFHSAPRHVQMIGLVSGSCAQVIAANQEIQDSTIVEINPGYLQLIPNYPDVPVCCIIPRCGLPLAATQSRRLLRRDVMNTTYHWRDHGTNLRSTDFLAIVHHPLNPGAYFSKTPRVRMK